MASAFQKLFRKRHSKQQQHPPHTLQHRHDQDAEALNHHSASKHEHKRHHDGAPGYFTVGSLNSPQTSQSGSLASSTNIYSSTTRSQFDLSSTHNYGVRTRSVSFGAQSMLRDGSHGTQPWKSPLLSSSAQSVAVDQFGNLVHGEASSETDHASSRPTSDDEDDIDRNPIYAALMGQTHITTHFRHVKILFIPSQRAVQAIKNDVLQRDAYILLHACVASTIFKDQFVSLSSTSRTTFVSTPSDGWMDVTLTATLKPETHSVHFLLTKPASPKRSAIRFEQRLRVESEVTTYRSIPSSSSKRDRIRIRVLTMDGLVVPPSVFTKRNGAMPLPSVASSKATVTQTDGNDEDDQASSITFPSKGTANVDSLAMAIPTSRVFMVDYALMVSPPAELEALRVPLQAALRKLERASANFTNAYVYVPGFDTYNVSRIRRGILAKSWQTFEEVKKEAENSPDGEDKKPLANDVRARLLLLLENVVMGHCHGKVYNSICSMLRSSDNDLDMIIATYHDSHVSLSDLGVTLPIFHKTPTIFAHAIQAFVKLGDPDEDFESILTNREPSRIQNLAINLSNPLSPTSNCPQRFRIRTPLDSLDVMRGVLDDINAAYSNQPSNSGFSPEKPLLSTDDLLPLLSYVLIQAMPRKLVSLLYYVRLFGLSDATSADHNWSLVTFETAIEYLSRDPLRLCGFDNKPPTVSPPLHTSSSSVRSLSPQTTSPPIMQRNVSNRSANKQSRPPSLHSGGDFFSSNDTRYTDTFPCQATSRTKRPSSTYENLHDDRRPDRTALFKVPGPPASATTIKSHNEIPCTTTLSDDVHGHSDVAEKGWPSTHHRRAASVSSDLKIRPQIVMHASRVSLSRSGTFERSHSTQSSSENALHSDIGHSDEQAWRSSPPLPGGAGRRKSTDSWSSLLNFAGRNTSPDARLDEPESDSTASKPERRPHTRIHLPRSATMSMTSPSASSTTNWLSAWTADWGRGSQSMSPSSSGMERTTSKDTSRPASIVSQDESLLSPILLPRTSSNRSIAGMVFPSMDSVPSLETHEHTLEDEGTGSSPRDPVSLKFSRRASGTPSLDQSTIRLGKSPVQENDVTGKNGDSPGKQAHHRRRTRSRLLSTSSPAEPLPPRLSADAASVLTSNHHHDVELSSLAANLQLGSFIQAPPDENILTNNAKRASTSPYTSPRAPLLRLHIPSPVDERADPLAGRGP